MIPSAIIEQRLQSAVRQLLPEADTTAVLVRPCPDPKFGDYQTNALISLAKTAKRNPRDLAAEVLAKLKLDDCCEAVEIAGAGFLNFRLKNATLSAALEAAARGEHRFFQRSAQPRSIVIDFSSPNVAKPMHVGHIRSTVLGDCLARTFRMLGHRVVADNHLGDWGTQFGMLLLGWKTVLDPIQLQADPLPEMERIYKLISSRCDPEKPGFDPPTLDGARAELVRLQAGDPESLAIWREMLRLSQAQFDSIYSRLDVRFDHAYGESFYNPRLKGVVDDLVRLGVASESQGAKVVLSDGSMPAKQDPFLSQKDGHWAPNPFIVQKSDGAFNYATTDLATLAFRIETWGADEIIYVTDGRQQLHFRQLFATFSRWQPRANVRLAHVWFGSILGEDGRPFKTRSGETIRLSGLLDEAEDRALRVVSEKSPELAEDERRNIARIVGIGAIKYADLLPNRQSDYVFNWDKLLALHGNTAPYIQYACARIGSIFRKAGIDRAELPGTKAVLVLAEREEIALARHLLDFGLVLDAVAREYRPNYLCNYLYELAGYFTAFFERCPVLQSVTTQRASRLMLCELTARVLQDGLTALGVQVPERM